MYPSPSGLTRFSRLDLLRSELVVVVAELCLVCAAGRRGVRGLEGRAAGSVLETAAEGEG